MNNKLVFALFMLLPIGTIAQDSNIIRLHSEFPVSQEVPAPECLGLPDDATISEDILFVFDITLIPHQGGGFNRIEVIESNGTASANEGEWIWHILAHHTRTVVFAGDFFTDPLITSIILNRLFVSKQIGVPNLHRTVNFHLVRNAVGEIVVFNGTPGVADFFCTP